MKTNNTNEEERIEKLIQSLEERFDSITQEMYEIKSIIESEEEVNKLPPEIKEMKKRINKVINASIL